jgi:hypothetical protein
MSTELLDEQDLDSRRNRSAWRQRLVDAEFGLKIGIRADSTLFVFFFVAATVVAMSLALGLSSLEWAMVILSLGFALTVELLHQMLRQMAQIMGDPFESVFPLGTTAVVVSNLSAAIVAMVLLWQHIPALWQS